MTERWPVTIQPVGPVAVATRIWRHRGSLHVTALAKATFSFAPGEAMRPDAPMPINVSEVPGGPARTTGSWAPSDLSPLLPRADVTFVGHAYAPARTGARSVRARLALSRPRTPGSSASEGPLLLDKSLEVVGARTATHAWPNPPAALFTRMALVYERAQGGTGHHTNPIGTGIEADVRGRTHMPNVVHPPHTAVPVEPAGFAPIPASWSLRSRLLPGLADMLRAPVATLPDGVDLAHFHAAPFDQRVEFLRGDEWIILDRLNMKHERLETRLPDVTGVARVFTRDGEQHALTMRADTLWIDGDGERCCVVWRGSFPVHSEAALPELAIAAGMEQAGVVTIWPGIDWPHSRVIERPHGPNSEPASMAARRTERGAALAGTVVLEAADEQSPATMVLSSTFVRGGTLVIDTEALATSPSPLPPAIESNDRDSAPPSNARLSIDRMAVADEDTVDADSKAAKSVAKPFGTEATLSPEEAAALSGSILLSDSDLLDVTDDAVEDAAESMRQAKSATGENQILSNSKSNLDVKASHEAASPASNGEGSDALSSRPTLTADPSRTSGVVPLSAWRDADDDDDDDDAETRARPSPLHAATEPMPGSRAGDTRNSDPRASDVGPIGEHAKEQSGPGSRAPETPAPTPRRRGSSPMHPRVVVRTHTPPPDSVERPTSSSPISSSPETTKRKGSRES